MFITWKGSVSKPMFIWLFLFLQWIIRDSRIATDKEVVYKWLRDQLRTFSNSISKLVDYWKRYIEKQGDCVEKWCNWSTPAFFVLIIPETKVRIIFLKLILVYVYARFYAIVINNLLILYVQYFVEWFIIKNND